MPKKSGSQPVEEGIKAPGAEDRVEAMEPVEPAVEKLFPFSVIIDGQDRTILAKDAEDLQVRIARIRGK
jgi:hypothetical protein